MKENIAKRNILCIDLKSFFASCECIERGLDPFKYPLVVANPNQGDGAITLAVTPFLKAKGVKSRGRLFEISKNIKYNIAKPRMNLYIKKSQEVISIYLNFISKDDLHVYSIDECFLDVTDYLKLYDKTDEELGKTILNEIFRKTGLTATCGIGPNMLLAKISMDLEAKHNKNNIAKWTYDDVKTKLWKITPLSNMWGIGKNLEKRLNNLNIYTVEDLALTNKYYLKDKFGIIGLELWNHANGIDSSTIKDYKLLAKEKSYSHSQVLFKDYNETNIKIIIREMVEVLGIKLHKNKKLTKCIGLGISYSKNIAGGFYHSVKIDNPTDSIKDIFDYCTNIFDRFYEYLPIRKVTVCLGLLEPKKDIQLNLFENNNMKNEEEISKAIIEIKDKFGKNSLIKAANLLDDSTAIERNKKTGGHYE